MRAQSRDHDLAGVEKAGDILEDVILDLEDDLD